jgi:hypothetical protein
VRLESDFRKVLTYSLSPKDHNLMFVPYLAAEEAETLDGIFREDEHELESE